MLIYSFLFELDLVNIDSKFSLKISEFYENKVFIVVLVLVTISFILRLLAIGMLLYYRCLIIILKRRKKNEREDSFINNNEVDQHLSLICQDTISTVSFSGKKYIGISESFIEKAKPNYTSLNNDENDNKINKSIVNEIIKKIENQESKKLTKSESGNLVPAEQTFSNETYSQADLALFEKFETPKFSKKT